MLNQHSKIAWAYEFDYAVDEVPEDGTDPPIVSYSRWLRTHRIFRSTGFVIDETLDYPGLVDSFLRQKLARDRKSIVGASVHRRFSQLLRIWPDARFIHLVRDPRDVAVSCVHRGWVGNVWEGAGMWQRSEIDWEILQRNVDDSRYIDIRFEQLVAHPERVLRELCDFIGVRFEPGMLKYNSRSNYAKPDAGFASKWKSSMPSHQVQLVEARVGELLVTRAYRPSELGAIKIGPLRKEFLRWHSRILRFFFRTKKYGMGLICAEIIARRLGFRAPKIRLRMNKIQERGLK